MSADSMDSIGVMNIPGYRISRKLGEGAMARVFLAVQESLGRQVALKVLAPALAAQRGFTRRFLNEGRIIAYLKHPQIVNIYDLGSHHHHYYLAMEFLSAGTLGQRIRQGIGPGRSVVYLKQIATALGFAHNQGVIHRDIKPQNILFRDDDLPVLTDFGIARLMDGSPHLTIPGRALGSPLYMSPEQISGRKIDARSDLYALGILFYKMLTNKLPYESDQIVTIALMHKTAPIPILPDDLSMLQPVLRKLLAKDPDQRFDSAKDLIEALTQIEANYPPILQKTDRSDSGAQSRDDPPPAPRIGLPDLCWTRPSDDQMMHALEPTLGADKAGKSTTGPDQATLWPENSAVPANGKSIGTSKNNSKWKRAVTIGTVATALAAVLLGWLIKMKPVVALSQSGFHPVPVTDVGEPLHAVQKVALSKTGLPEQIPPNTLRSDMTTETAAPAGDRTAVDQTVADLMARAQVQLSAYRLTSPAGDNSYETYRQILALDPASPEAASLATRIAATYRKLAIGAKAKGGLRQGLAYIDKGLKIRPGDSALLALQAELQTRIDKQIRIKAERARLAEQREHRRAAEQAAIEARRKAELELSKRQGQTTRQHRPEPDRTRMNKQQAIQEEKKQQEVKKEIEQPEVTGKEFNPKNRLFGTF